MNTLVRTTSSRATVQVLLTEANVTHSARRLASSDEKIRSGDLPPDYDPRKELDPYSDNDPYAHLMFNEYIRQKWRERKGYPHPFDELDPDDVPYHPKKAQFPF